MPTRASGPALGDRRRAGRTGRRPRRTCFLDGRDLSPEVDGRTGRVIGMYATQGTVHFDWFDYEPVDDGAHRGATR